MQKQKLILMPAKEKFFLLLTKFLSWVFVNSSYIQAVNPTLALCQKHQKQHYHCHLNWHMKRLVRKVLLLIILFEGIF
jgi:hypothetical protein